MKKFKILFIILSISISVNIYSQLSCGTPTNSIVQNFANGDSNFTPTTTPICINVQFQIVRTTAGSGGTVITTLDQVNNLLNNHLNPHNIFVNKIGIDYINNSTYYDMNDAQFNSLVAINNNPNAINFYIINSCSNWVGRASSITSRNLVIVNSYCTTGVSAHEFGHCLNLWHTFQGTASGTTGCPELINGSNCSSCGDYVCDTPADANIGAINGYNPDLSNDMSYSSPSSLTHFTTLQGTRMRDALNGSTVLQPIIGNLCKSIVGSEILCASPNQSYTVSNSATNNITWSYSPNIQMVSQNSTTLVARAFSNTSATGTITATINGQSITKTIYLGSPLLPATGVNTNVIWVRKGMVNGFGFNTITGATSYLWTIVRLPDPDFTTTCLINIQAKFSTNSLQTLTTTLPITNVNVGTCISDYIITCTANNACGSSVVYERYLTVGNSGSSPCVKNTTFSRYSIIQNPLKEGVLKLKSNLNPKLDIVDIRDEELDSNIVNGDQPCEGPWPYNGLKLTNNINGQPKEINIMIYDFYGKVVYENMIPYTDKEIILDNLKLKQEKYIIVINDEIQIEKQIIIIE